MRARDLMRPVVVVGPDAPAERLLEAFEDPDLRAVAVVSADGELIGMVTDEDVLYCLLPSYVLEDEALARVLEEAAGEELRNRTRGRTVEQVVHTRRRAQPPVGPDDTLVEVAAAMARSGDPAVLVVEEGRAVGVVTVDILLPALLSGTR